MDQVSLTRRNLLRGCYLLLLVGLGVQVWPRLLGTTAAAPFNEGVVDAMLSALALVSILGVFSPLRMLPLLFFEIAWKAIWTASVAVPRWRTDAMDESIAATLYACAWVIPFILIIPWRWAAGAYLGPMEGWRR